MNNYYEYNDCLRIKVYDDGRLINTVELTFNDYEKSYEAIEIYGNNYDYYEDRYFD